MSKHTITFDQLVYWKACHLHTRKELFASRATLSVSQAIDAGETVSDILWVAGKLKLTIECVIFAIRCAERVAYLNNDPRVQKAIDTAKEYVKKPTADAAAYAANAASAAARASYEARANAAAYAANAASAAAVANAAAYAANAAYAAARAAARASDAATYAEASATYAARAADDAADAARAADAADDAETEKFQKDLLIEIFE